MHGQWAASIHNVGDLGGASPTLQTDTQALQADLPPPSLAWLSRQPHEDPREMPWPDSPTALLVMMKHPAAPFYAQRMMDLYAPTMWDFDLCSNIHDPNVMGTPFSRNMRLLLEEMGVDPRARSQAASMSAAGGEMHTEVCRCIINLLDGFSKGQITSPSKWFTSVLNESRDWCLRPPMQHPRYLQWAESQGLVVHDGKGGGRQGWDSWSERSTGASSSDRDRLEVMPWRSSTPRPSFTADAPWANYRSRDTPAPALPAPGDGQRVSSITTTHTFERDQWQGWEWRGDR